MIGGSGIVDYAPVESGLAEKIRADATGLGGRNLSVNFSALFSFLSGALPANASLTRASANGTRINASASLEVMGANVARFTYNPATLALRGLLVEPARTNAVPNNSSFTGLVAGSPGTIPTGYSGGTATGATRTLAAPSSANGIPYFSSRWNAAVAQTTTVFLNMMPNAAQAATLGQTWGYSEYLKLLAGSNTNLVASPSWRISGRDSPSGMNETENFSVTQLPTSAAMAIQRASVTGALASASTAFVSAYMRVATNTVNPSDYTYAIGGQQLEFIPAGQSGVSSLILTSGTAGTRAEDVLTLTVQPATYDISIVRESGTTTLTGVYCPGTFVVPTSVSPLQRVIFTNVGPVPDLDFYEDSVSGLDTNYGTSPNQAWQNLTALPALSNRAGIGLGYGSSWSEQDIDTAAANVEITAFGDEGDGLPEIDANGDPYCINLSGTGTMPLGHRISNVSCTSATDNNGSIVAQGYAVIDGVEALNGASLHNLLFGYGSLSNSTIQDGAGTDSLVVAFTTVDGQTYTVQGNEIGGTTLLARSGLISHTNGVARFAQGNSIGNHYFNLANAITVGLDLDTFRSEDDVFEDCSSGLAISCNADIVNPTFSGGIANSRFLEFAAPNITIILTGGRLCVPTTSTAIRSNETGITLNIGGGIKFGITPGSQFSLMEIAHGTVTMGDCEFDIPSGQAVAILGRGTPVTFTTPGHFKFATATDWYLEINGDTFSGLAACQAEGYFLDAEVGTVGACV